MQKHHDSETELTPLQIHDLVEREEITTPILAYKVIGGRVELYLLGGAVAAVEPHWLRSASSVEPLTRETAEEIPERLEEMTFDRLYELAQRLEIRGRSNLNKPGLIEAIRQERGLWK